MLKKVDQSNNEELRRQSLEATEKELIKMYIKGTNKYALNEMRIRGIY